METQRRLPPIFGGFRIASKDIEYGRYVIPKGWQVSENLELSLSLQSCHICCCFSLYIQLIICWFIFIFSGLQAWLIWMIAFSQNYKILIPANLRIKHQSHPTAMFHSEQDHGYVQDMNLPGLKPLLQFINWLLISNGSSFVQTIFFSRNPMSFLTKGLPVKVTPKKILWDSSQQDRTDLMGLEVDHCQVQLVYISLNKDGGGTISYQCSRLF